MRTNKDRAIRETGPDRLEMRGEFDLPPRKNIHPSEKGKWTRRFYAVLVFLFVVLILALIAWFVWKYE